MNNLLKTLVVLSILLNITLIYFFIFRGEVTQELDDSRSAIMMQKNDKELVLSEMRGFLESVQQIHDGIVNNNPEQIIAGSHVSGDAAVQHVPKGLLKALPLGFKQLGFDTHDAFDEIAKIAKENYDQKTLQLKLNSVLNNCVTCHRAYKINLKDLEDLEAK